MTCGNWSFCQCSRNAELLLSFLTHTTQLIFSNRRNIRSVKTIKGNSTLPNFRRCTESECKGEKTTAYENANRTNSSCESNFHTQVSTQFKNFNRKLGRSGTHFNYTKKQATMIDSGCDLFIFGLVRKSKLYEMFGLISG